MTELSPGLSMLLGFAAFAGLWLVLATLFNRLSGMQGRLPIDTGRILRVSPWGDAEVNGVSCENCIRVVECANGWQVQSHWIAGGGRLWLPRRGTRVGELQVPTGEWGVRSRLLEAGSNRVKLEGELADFIAESRSDGPAV